MPISLQPAFISRLRQAGLSASFSAILTAGEAQPLTGLITAFGAAGRLRLAGGQPATIEGDSGGQFSLRNISAGVEVSFSPGPAGAGLAPGGAVTTRATARVTDGDSITRARLSVTLVAPIAPPKLIRAIPDQTIFIAAAILAPPRLVRAIPDQEALIAS